MDPCFCFPIRAHPSVPFALRVLTFHTNFFIQLKKPKHFPLLNFRFQLSLQIQHLFSLFFLLSTPTMTSVTEMETIRRVELLRAELDRSLKLAAADASAGAVGDGEKRPIMLFQSAEAAHVQISVHITC